MNDTAKPQEEVLAFLADPAAYGGRADKVRRIDTHAASVFLAGDRVLKVKRAVRFPFLDYSTLAKRKAACAAEIEVNRRLAPNLYRGVVAVTVCRQEGGACMMAEAVGKVTGQPGVCFVTRGPGATNASPGIHIARQDSSPLVKIGRAHV